MPEHTRVICKTPKRCVFLRPRALAVSVAPLAFVEVGFVFGGIGVIHPSKVATVANGSKMCQRYVGRCASTARRAGFKHLEARREANLRVLVVVLRAQRKMVRANHCDKAARQKNENTTRASTTRGKRNTTRVRAARQRAELWSLLSQFRTVGP